MLLSQINNRDDFYCLNTNQFSFVDIVLKNGNRDNLPRDCWMIKNQCTIWKNTGADLGYSRGGGGFSKILTTFFLGPPNWYCLRNPLVLFKKANFGRPTLKLF